MIQEQITMSNKELHRLEVMVKLKERRLYQREAAALLGISVRQVKRLWSRYRELGARGLVSGHRGKVGTRCLGKGLVDRAKSLIREHYADFGPTLAQEKLAELHGIAVSVETVRQWMVSEGLWKAKAAKRVRVHQQRERRACFGELVQIDGSPHDWFEGRAPKCTLLVIVDDATSCVLGLRFCDAETTQDYFTLMKRYIDEYGLPVAIYSDKHSIFKVNIQEAKSGTGKTQFGRAMNQLGIEHITAHSPQAKGRVERYNGIFQDRLVKELRLQGINNQAQANAYLPEFIEKINQRFVKAPKCDTNAHRELTITNEALGHILSAQSHRTLSRNLECSYNNVLYQVQAQERKYRMQHSQVLICEDAKGTIRLFDQQNNELTYKTLDKQNQSQPVHDSKTLNRVVSGFVLNPRKAHKPKQDNPWRRFTINPRKQSNQNLSR